MVRLDLSHWYELTYCTGTSWSLARVAWFPGLAWKPIINMGTPVSPN